MGRRWRLCFGLIGSVALAACDAPAPGDGGTRDGGGADAQIAGRCGDGEVGAGEQCDDGNDVAFDGCEPVTCTFTCEGDASCDDGEPCNGVESCDLETHACEAGDAPDDGDACTTAGVDDGVCRAGSCVDAGCGNGVVDGAEDCDDANTVSGDGCENDCRFSCTQDEDCITPDVCDGTESCDLETHTCVTTGPPDCDDGNPCTEDSCHPVEECVHTLIDDDGDGHASTDLGACGDDCDDDDPRTYAGAPELCEVGAPVDNDLRSLDAEPHREPVVPRLRRRLVRGEHGRLDDELRRARAAGPMRVDDPHPDHRRPEHDRLQRRERRHAPGADDVLQLAAPVPGLQRKRSLRELRLQRHRQQAVRVDAVQRQPHCELHARVGLARHSGCGVLGHRRLDGGDGAGVRLHRQLHELRSRAGRVFSAVEPR